MFKFQIDKEKHLILFTCFSWNLETINENLKYTFLKAWMLLFHNETRESLPKGVKNPSRW